MAPGGVNKAIVLEARRALLAHGENPSIEAVRIEIGNTGSKTTIHRYLKEIEDFDPRPRASRERLSDELTELVAGLLERMTEEGGEALAHAQARFDEQRSELDQKLDGLNAELASLQREMDSQKGALGLQADELQTCQASLQAKLTRNARLRAKIAVTWKFACRKRMSRSALWKISTCIHVMHWDITATRSRNSGIKNSSDTKGKCSKFRLSYDSSSRL